MHMRNGPSIVQIRIYSSRACMYAMQISHEHEAVAVAVAVAAVVNCKRFTCHLLQSATIITTNLPARLTINMKIRIKVEN